MIVSPETDGIPGSMLVPQGPFRVARGALDLAPVLTIERSFSMGLDWFHSYILDRLFFESFHWLFGRPSDSGRLRPLNLWGSTISTT